MEWFQKSSIPALWAIAAIVFALFSCWIWVRGKRVAAILAFLAACVCTIGWVAEDVESPVESRHRYEFEGRI